MALNHLAIIADGNRRFGRARGGTGSDGHQKGADNTDVILRWCRNNEVSYLTLYLFSLYNWERPPDEVAFLMRLIKHFCESKKAELLQDNVRVCVIGNLADPRFPDETRAAVECLVAATAGCTGLTLILALSYDGVDEVRRAGKRWQASDCSGEVTDFLDTALLGIPDPDLVLRTSGEQRLSGFLSLQASYAELMFVDAAYPELSVEVLDSVMAAFQQRDRRFGKR